MNTGWETNGTTRDQDRRTGTGKDTGRPLLINDCSGEQQDRQGLILSDKRQQAKCVAHQGLVREEKRHDGLDITVLLINANTQNICVKDST